MKKYLPLLGIVTFFILIFLLSLRDPTQNTDMWFHIASGRVIAEHGITHVDFASYLSKGREWYPYEWFFQFISYELTKTFGLHSLSYLDALGAIITIAAVFSLLRYIFRLSLPVTMLMCFMMFVWGYDIIQPRPGLFALACLLWNLFFLFLFILKNKNLLWITLPITYLWANIHGSIIVDVFVFGSYSGVCLALTWLQKDNKYLQKGKVLLLFTILTFLITIAPPLYTTQYRLLLLFGKYNYISDFISEWQPLFVNNNLPTIIQLNGVFLIGILLWLWTWIRYKQWRYFYLSIPLLFFIPLPYISVRHQYMSMIIIGILASWAISLWQEKKECFSSLLVKILFILLVLLHVGIFLTHRFNPPYAYPTKALNFMTHERINGNIYNSTQVGNYLFYYFYPERKVFTNAALDLYLCCELPMVHNVVAIISHNQGSPQNKLVINQFMTNLDISYAILDYWQSNDRVIANDLHNEQQWHLVYWDDEYVIYVKDDGKNTSLLKNFATKAADPFSDQLYKTNKQQEALSEYYKMAKMSDSAVTEVAISKIALDQKNKSLAESAIQKALFLDPGNVRVHLLAGEIYLQFKQYESAIPHYEKVVSLDPSQTQAYIRLAGLYAATFQLQKTHSILQQGIDNSKNDKDKKTLQSLIQLIPAQ